MHTTAPSPQAAQQGLAEKFGEFSQGLAANGGGDWLSALLINLIALIIEALRSITWPAQEAAAPVEADRQTLSPRHGSPKAALTAPTAPRRRRKPKPPKKPVASKAHAPVAKTRRALSTKKSAAPEPEAPSAAQYKMGLRHRPTAGISKKSDIRPGRLPTPISLRSRNERRGPGQNLERAKGIEPS